MVYIERAASDWWNIKLVVSGWFTEKNMGKIGFREVGRMKKRGEKTYLVQGGISMVMLCVCLVYGYGLNMVYTKHTDRFSQ